MSEFFSLPIARSTNLADFHRCMHARIAPARILAVSAPLIETDTSIMGLAWSQDGTLLAAAVDDCLRLVDPATGFR